MNSFNLHYLLIGSISKYSHTRVKVSTYEFRGNNSVHNSQYTEVFWKDTQHTAVNTTYGKWCWDSKLALFFYLNFLNGLLLKDDDDKRILVGRSATFYPVQYDRGSTSPEC